MLVVCIRVLVVCIRMLLVCYSYVSRMRVVCIRMYPYVPYVTRMLLVCYPYVLVWCFSHDRVEDEKNKTKQNKVMPDCIVIILIRLKAERYKTYIENASAGN